MQNEPRNHRHFPSRYIKIGGSFLSAEPSRQSKNRSLPRRSFSLSLVPVNLAADSRRKSEITFRHPNFRLVFRMIRPPFFCARGLLPVTHSASAAHSDSTTRRCHLPRSHRSKQHAMRSSFASLRTPIHVVSTCREATVSGGSDPPDTFGEAWFLRLVSGGFRHPSPPQDGAISERKKAAPLGGYGAA